MRKKILVVDDDRSLLTYLSFNLSELGHEVLTAEDGLSALNILTTFDADVIFVDLILPKIDGENLCRVIRTMRHLDEAYLVVMSSALSEYGLDVKSVGADACIAKGALTEMADHVLEAIRESDLPRGDDEIVVRGKENLSPRRTTRELLGQKRHLETILENLELGLVEVFLGRVIYLNQSAATLIGRAKAEILNTNPADLFDEEGGARIRALIDAEGGSIPGRTGDDPLVNGRRNLSVTCRRLEDEASTLLILREMPRAGRDD